MDYVLIGEIDVLDSLSGAITADAETFLIELETELENDFITMDEAIERIKDFNQRR